MSFIETAAAAGYQAFQGLRATPSVRGRTVVVVGASAGIGRSVALEYARGGAEVLLCARRAAELEQVTGECLAAGAAAAHWVAGVLHEAAAAAGYQAFQGLRATPSVRGRTVVVVGASAGIGRSVALEYARGGAEVLLCARRAAELERVAGECVAAGAAAAHWVAGDVTRLETQLAVRERAGRSWDRVDYLVLCAGALSVQAVVDLWGMRQGGGGALRAADGAAAERADRALRRIMDVNVHAPAALAALLLPLVAAGRGVIVVVASAAGLMAAPTRALYSASKHAVAAYFDALRMEVRGLGVAVTVAYPGSVDTALRHSAVDAPAAAAAPPPAASAGPRMAPAECARRIVRAAALRRRALVTPWPYAAAALLHAVAPALVDALAERKYRQRA
ncbi:hypothetical protein H4R18_002571 [Coemansia javaensis]|uniref:Short-chain dehydrogenase n=1 Tax=Coemansia javaensis TaxID=2761396 RepID=A0A9W8HBF6_9FUNG|nr:hypothetical protein H4R18_002571 [Coemansia javaensis]